MTQPKSPPSASRPLRATIRSQGDKNASQIRLILSSDFGEPQVWEFTGPRAVVIGRGQRSTLKLSDTEEYRAISGHHAVIELSRSRAFLRDLRSLNGTFINGHLVNRREEDRAQGVAVSGAGVQIKDGDIMTLSGSFNFRIGLVDESAYDTPKSSSPLEVNPKCPSCGRAHDPIPLSRYADVLCQDCRSNPLASLKLLKAGLTRRVKILDSLKGLRITRTLGRGSTSAVFLAERKDNGQQLALKVMSPAISENEWARKSFLREVAIGRALKHPNVTKLFDFGFYGGAYYYLMEFCQGGNSEEARVKAGGSLTPAHALEIVIPVLNGLNYLHNVKLAASKVEEHLSPESRGLVHRDLKPANIFLGGQDGKTPKIADIGVGKLYNNSLTFDHTRTGSVAGSPATMPRQQVLDFKHAGPEVDVWAVAASLYKLLTGEYPRDFPEDEDPWRVVLNKNPVPIRSRRPNIPPYLAKVIDAALVDRPNIEFQKAQVLKDALIDAAKKDGINLNVEG
ncbi:MAG: protein kinase [Deltaproteobacteria bacterium]|jgi:pSer/pThr/pTyr-binding forkhead associated (FHA) protein|nr:protein kinase [Deltaproteobacteria bacterium]